MQESTIELPNGDKEKCPLGLQKIRHKKRTLPINNQSINQSINQGQYGNFPLYCPFYFPPTRSKPLNLLETL